jgi:hypothetical protein
MGTHLGRDYHVPLWWHTSRRAGSWLGLETAGIAPPPQQTTYCLARYAKTPCRRALGQTVVNTLYDALAQIKGKSIHTL